MRKIHAFASLFVPVLLLGLMWPQAQPKPRLHQLHMRPHWPPLPDGALRTITVTVMVYVFIVRLRRKARLFRRALRLNAGTGAIRSASTEGERVRIMEEWRSGCESYLH